MIKVLRASLLARILDAIIMSDLDQTVPGAPHCHDVIASAVISPELTPQVHDVNAQVGPRLALIARIPQHAFGQVAIRVQLARRTYQRYQQAELGRRQRWRFA